jgi:alcohol dehydrogenase, propanol-preferring
LIHVPFKTVDLKNLPKVCEIMQEGKITGRYVLKMPDAE